MSDSSTEVLIYPYQRLRMIAMMMLGCLHGFVLLGILAYVMQSNPMRMDYLVGGIGIVLIAVIPSLRLHFDYWKHSRGRKITISMDQILSEGGDFALQQSIKFNELETIEVVSSGHIKAPWGIYNHFILIGRDGTRILIPCYLLRYHEFTTAPLVRNQLIEKNPKVVGIYRFPKITER